MLLFEHEDLWSRLEKLSVKARRRCAAVAYVTSDARVAFGRGDLLVCDASDEAIRTGQTSARVLADAVGRGAAVFSLRGLHAKVLVLDDTAVVGSANLSATSERLAEAAVRIDDARLVAKARAFVHTLAERGEAVDARFLGRIASIEVTARPRGAPGVRRPPGGRGLASGASRIWLVAMSDLDEGAYPDERRADERGYARAETLLGRLRADLRALRVADRSAFRREARPGDLLIEAHAPKRKAPPTVVYWPAPILHRVEGRAAAWTRFYYASPMRRYTGSLTWARFLTLLRGSGGPRALSHGVCRELPSDVYEELERRWGLANRGRKS